MGKGDFKQERVHSHACERTRLRKREKEEEGRERASERAKEVIRERERPAQKIRDCTGSLQRRRIRQG